MVVGILVGWLHPVGAPLGMCGPQAPSHEEASPVVIALIDTGVDYSDENIRDKLYLLGEAVTEHHFGWDASVRHHRHTAHDFGVKGGGPNFHGSQMAYIIQKFEPQAKIYPIKYINERSMDALMRKEYHRNLIALEKAVEMDVRIINYSVKAFDMEPTGSTFERLKRVVKKAMEKDILMVMAAGNQAYAFQQRVKRNHFPQTFEGDHLLVVGAYHPWPRGQGYDVEPRIRGPYLRKNSNVKVGPQTIPVELFKGLSHATHFDILAPGAHQLYPSPKGEIMGTGTSQATAHVSAVASKVRRAFPNLKAHEVRRCILDSAMVFEHLKGHCLSGGILDEKGALSKAKAISGL